MPKANLTKSLHTITAVANVGRHLAKYERDSVGNHRVYWTGAAEGKALAREALAVLGYDLNTLTMFDETVQRCFDACTKVLSQVRE